MTRIVIDKLPCPLPVLASSARRWKRREEWASQTEEARPAASVAEPDAFLAKIRSILFGREQ